MRGCKHTNARSHDSLGIGANMLQGLCEGQLQRSIDLIGRVCKRLWSSYRLGRGHGSVSYSDSWSYSSEYGSAAKGAAEGRGVAPPQLDAGGSWKTPRPRAAATRDVEGEGPSAATAFELRDWLWSMVADKQRGIMELLASILATDDGFRAQRVASLLSSLAGECAENWQLRRRRHLVRVRSYLIAKIYFDEAAEAEEAAQSGSAGVAVSTVGDDGLVLFLSIYLFISFAPSLLLSFLSLGISLPLSLSLSISISISLSRPTHNAAGPRHHVAAR